MTVVLIEGFDHLASVTNLKGWTITANAGSPGAGTDTTTRFGVGRAFSQQADQNGFITKALPSSYTTLFAGFAFQLTKGGTFDIASLRVAAGGTQVLRVHCNGPGNPLSLLNSAGSTIATGITPIATNAWNFVEFKAFVNVGTPASGTADLHVNGVAEFATQTTNLGSSAMTVISIGPIGTASVWGRWDDLYVADSTGTAPLNDLFGDVRVQTVYPVGAGAHTQFQPNGAVNNWQCVDEATPNDDTDYVSDANPGDIDTYDFTSIDGGATVFGVQNNLYARKDDANTRQIASVVRQSGADTVGATKTLGTSYAVFSELYGQDPSSTNWTAINLNADEFGVKEIA